MNNMGGQLILVVTASYVGAVGYGEIFNCLIKRVVTGAIAEPRIVLTVLAGDVDNYKFITGHLQPAQIEIGFAFNQNDEPYSMAPISGFVDKSKTSWKIQFVREAKK